MITQLYQHYNCAERKPNVKKMKCIEKIISAERKSLENNEQAVLLRMSMPDFQQRSFASREAAGNCCCAPPFGLFEINAGREAGLQGDVQ